MIISFYTTKGGAGKSSTLLAILSAIVDRNMNGQGSEGKTCLVIDFDDQGSVMKFAELRARDKGKETNGIAFSAMTLSEDTPSTLHHLKARYDYVLCDLPGVYSDEAVAAALNADILVIPAGLTVFDVVPALELYNHLGTLIREHELDLRLRLLVTQNESNFNFETNIAKRVYFQMTAGGYKLLKGTISKQVAVRNMVGTGMYLGELREINRSSKTVNRALDDAKKVLDDLVEDNIIPADPAHV